METVLQIGLVNALGAGILMVPAALASRGRRPALAHALWLLVLLKLLAPPLWPIPVASPWALESKPAVSPPSAPTGSAMALPPTLALELLNQEPEVLVEEPAEAAGSASTPPVSMDATGPSSDSIPWLGILGGVWLVGSLAWFTLAGLRVARFQRLLQHASPASPVQQSRVRELASQLGVRAPHTVLVPGRVAPLLWAVGRTRLVLPAWLLEQVDPTQLDALLAHELAHLRRRDHWVRAIEFVALGLYWWLPVVWVARHALRDAEEQCCDAWVVATLPEAGRAYADALVDTLDFLTDAPAAPLLASGIGQVSDLKWRLRMILTGTPSRSLGWRGVALVLALGLLLPLAPLMVQAEDRKDGEPRREPPKPEDVEKAKAEIKKLRDDLDRKAAEIAELGKKLHEAHQKLGGPEGRPGPGGPPPGGEPRAFILRQVDGNWMIMPAPNFEGRFGRGPGGPGGPRGPDGRPGPEGRGPEGRRPDGRPGDEGRPGPEGRPPFGRRGPREGGPEGRPGPDGRPPFEGRGPRERGPEGGPRGERRPEGPGGPEGGRRVEELERRLDRVLQELENLRRELGPRRGPGGEGPPPPRP